MAARDQLGIFVVDIRVDPAAESQHGLEPRILGFQAGEFPVEILVDINFWEARPDLEGVVVQLGERVDKMSA